MLKNKKKKTHDISKFTLIGGKAPFMYNESYKNLRTNLDFLTFEHSLKTIAVTSTLSGEGKTSISINLAITLAQSGKKVVLVDLDLRKPSIHKYLGLKNKDGIGSIIRGKDVNPDFIMRIKELGIDVLLGGIKAPNASELIGSTRMKQIISNLENEYDYVIIDTPPVGVVTDTAILSRYVNGIIFVVKQNFSTKKQIQYAYKNLLNVEANILGVILNQYDMDKDNKSFKGEQYYYSYYSYGVESGEM